MGADWDGRAYRILSEPQLQWGRKVLDRVALRGDERVLDAGCGAGRVTALICERVPRGHVLAVDRSQSMLETARGELARFANVELFRADVSALPLERAVDGIFSTATFHWVHDHTALFASLYRALAPGGWVEAQFGGGANIARLLERVDRLVAQPTYAPSFAGFRPSWYFADAETTAARLRAAGFFDVKTWLETEDPRFADADEYMSFLEKIILRDHLARLPAALHPPFLRALADEARGDYVIDYVRLNLRARRPDAAGAR
jgi:trans-aconitate methyltransferase